MLDLRHFRQNCLAKMNSLQPIDIIKFSQFSYFLGINKLLSFKFAKSDIYVHLLECSPTADGASCVK